MQWLKNGDRNTKFFYSYVTGRRKKLDIGEILDEQGVMLDREDRIGNETVKFYMR